MATETVDPVTDPFETRLAWKHGAIAGLLATIGMGLAISVMDIELLRVAIAGLYGQEGSLATGWLAHLIHGTLFGIVFALVRTEPALAGFVGSSGKTVAAAIVYALVLTLAGAGIVMPIWLSMVGFASPLPVPNLSLASVLWHLIYGVLLGSLFAAFQSLE
ncbi:histidine kinase [Natrialbaceae archaeon A-chndr2]|uniref:Histidine kinase n=1 Tax=Natronosalvus hydrolyticus TaxID=2979988 RepID=A0AAP2Z604_9EURY|nr:histidine kinase [Halobacteria archaeon AArc-curdl1]